MVNPLVVILCLDEHKDKSGFPIALSTLDDGIPALDGLLHQLRRCNVDEIVVVCHEATSTRYFAYYALLRNVKVVPHVSNNLSSLLTQSRPLCLVNGGVAFDKNFALCDVLASTSGKARTFHIDDTPVLSVFPTGIKCDVTITSEASNTSILSATSKDSEFIASLATEVHLLSSESGLISANKLVQAQAQLLVQGLPEVVEEQCHARVGMMGNPSDGFNGKTVSFLIENFRASVRVESRPRELGVEIVDPLQFTSLHDLQLQSNLIGYTSGGRLLQATCKVFSQLCFQNNLTVHKLRCFRMTYDTNIPRMVGLSGSSAIIVAAFRALLKFYGLTIADLHININELPQHILDIEKVELNISAGLQDRVIQSYGGLVHMDFTKPASDPTRYTPLDPELLPPMYLAYDACAGGDSGKVHSTVKDRWAQQDPELVQGMQTLGGYADEARACLERADICRLAELMEANFAMRRKLYGDAVVGAKNIRMVELAKRHGMSAKFTGSGGALLLIESNGWGWLDVEEEAKLTAEYEKEGFNLVRIRIPRTNNEPTVKYLSEKCA